MQAFNLRTHFRMCLDAPSNQNKRTERIAIKEKKQAWPFSLSRAQTKLREEGVEEQKKEEIKNQEEEKEEKEKEEKEGEEEEEEDRTRAQ